jgi:PAS domain S-box-containing protein
VLENAERLGMAMDVAQMTAWEWHLASGAMTWASDPEALFGFPAGAFGPERRIVRVLHAEDRERVEGCMREALQSGAYDCEYRVVRPDGSIVWLTERGRVVPGESGQGDRMVGITRDVTAEREAAREREELLRRAREARDEAELQVRLKDDFLATLSHELRTPMNAVLGWLAILQQDDTLPGEARNTLGIIERNATIQAKLIEDLLDMTRLMTGNIQLEMGVVDLTAVLEMTVQAIRPTAQAKQVAIALQQDVSAPAVVGDARRLQQVFWNLVHNGVKFTPSGGRVEVRVQDAGGTLAVDVTDTGRGITPAFLPHVFERFRQEDPSTTRESFGLGLGLSIARHLVELHGGSIEALSGGPGTGATFRVLLPALPATGAGRIVQSGTRSVAAP